MKSFKYFVVFFLLNGVSCAGLKLGGEKPIPLGAEVKTPAPWIEHVGDGPFKNYLAMNLPYPPVEKVLLEVEGRLGTKLKNRGEAHITVITPIEYDKVLSKYLSMQKINELALKARLQEAAFETPCVGRGSINLDGRGEQTYYIVALSPALLELRKQIQSAYAEAGGKAEDFKAEQYYPHITLGFTKRDLHFEDGVIKDETSCLIPVESARP